MIAQTGQRSGRLLFLDGETGHILCNGEIASVRLSYPHDAKIGDFVEISSHGDVHVLQAYTAATFPTPGTDLERFVGESKWNRLKKRAQLVKKTREFFDRQGFLEVETPLLVASPGTEVHLDAISAKLRPGPDQKAESRFLITSPEYHMKRLMSAGSGPIYQLAKVFRDGEFGGHHRPEFTMLEWYRPFATYDALMTDCEGLFCHLAEDLTLQYDGQPIDLTRPWPRIPFRDALTKYGGVDPGRLSLDQQLECMVSQVEPALDRSRPIFITEFPIGLASLAREKPSDHSVAERFELFIGGLELANAFGELTDAKAQRARCENEVKERQELGKNNQPMDEDFLGALEEGCPPSSGIALGIDRLIMLLTDARTIDQVLPF